MDILMDKYGNFTKPYLAGVLSLDTGVAGEYGSEGLPTAQWCFEVKGFLRRSRKCTEQKLIVEITQFIVMQHEPCCSLT